MARSGQTGIKIRLLEIEGDTLSILDVNNTLYEIPRAAIIDGRAIITASEKEDRWILQEGERYIVSLAEARVQTVLKWAFVNQRFTYDTIAAEGGGLIVVFPEQGDSIRPTFRFTLDMIDCEVQLSIGGTREVWYDASGIIHIVGPVKLMTDVRNGSMLNRQKT
ncbi:MAG: hypothetical protein WC505_05395 [Patescibacteria group bacterium]